MYYKSNKNILAAWDGICRPANWTIAGPSGQAPGGVYMHQHNSYFTQQEEQTVEYNCRMETRTVWVPVDGEHCPMQP